MVKELFIEADFSRLGIDADGKEIVTVHGCAGQPDLSSQDDRRGPSAVRNFRFPFDILSFAPVKRQPDSFAWPGLCDLAITRRAAKLRPVRPRRIIGKAGENQKNENTSFPAPF